MADCYDNAMQKLQAIHLGPRGGEVGALPAIITVIMDIIKQLLASCPASASQLKAAAAAPTEQNRFLVRRAVRQELRDRYGLGGYAMHNGDKICKTIMQAGAEASAEEIEQLMQD